MNIAMTLLTVFFGILMTVFGIMSGFYLFMNMKTNDIAEFSGVDFLKNNIKIETETMERNMKQRVIAGALWFTALFIYYLMYTVSLNNYYASMATVWFISLGSIYIFYADGPTMWETKRDLTKISNS